MAAIQPRRGNFAFRNQPTSDMPASFSAAGK
jgi:hypothetical protein